MDQPFQPHSGEFSLSSLIFVSIIAYIAWRWSRPPPQGAQNGPAAKGSRNSPLPSLEPLDLSRTPGRSNVAKQNQNRSAKTDSGLQPHNGGVPANEQNVYYQLPPERKGRSCIGCCCRCCCIMACFWIVLFVTFVGLLVVLMVTPQGHVWMERMGFVGFLGNLTTNHLQFDTITRSLYFRNSFQGTRAREEAPGRTRPRRDEVLLSTPSLGIVNTTTRWEWNLV